MHFPHAVRDPIHGYIRLTDLEIRGMDTPEVQRLRGIAQLGLTERVFPGARHSRFEHALGALEVVTRIFEELRGRLGIQGVLEPLGVEASLKEYEHLVSVARWVALLHDLGHAPFSHVTEGLLPNGRDHEEVTSLLVESGRIGEVLADGGDRLSRDVRNILAARSRSAEDELPSALRFVREAIAGPVGADRMDYLLRDSHATGVSYGVFDLSRVLHTLVPVESDDDAGIRLGIRRSGVLAAEGMLWARFSMFQQVYLHRTRRILDRHLNDFLRAALPGGCYPAAPEAYAEYADARVWEMLRSAQSDPDHPGHLDAVRVLTRAHHRSLGQELESEDRGRILAWLDDWARRIAESDPDADPITDLVLPHSDADSGAALPVVLADRVVPLEETSSLVGRFRLRPLGRIYVAPHSRTRTEGAGRFEPDCN